MQIEVVYALPDQQTVLTVEMPEGSTVLAAIEQSGILTLYPKINLTEHPVGIFGQIVTLETVLEAQDRIEIYRPLVLDPMEARRNRAAKQKSLRRSHQNK